MTSPLLYSRRRAAVPFLLASLGACSLMGAPPADDPVSQSVKSFTEIFDAVEQNFADHVDPDKTLYSGAIPGMLRTLDPHSNFMDPKAFAATRDEQRGQYYGVGMQVGPRNGKTLVMWPFEGSPAYRAGLRPGDAIAMVNGTKTAGLNTTAIADLLRGPRGTKVQVNVDREGLPGALSFDIVRDAIPRSCVPDVFWLKPGIAYVSITGFICENTSKELIAKLAQLGESNINGMVLDLRGNPGGLVNEGVDVAGHFLKKGSLVVSLRGRAQPNKNYFGSSDNGGREYPIVVVVNGSSASASEIVTGALQDHDRAWVLGDTTFGKGLAQSVFQLSQSTGLALTTAHYYTPSGRLIQRDYSNISFLDYYYHLGDQKNNKSDVKMTDSGRTVYGGGGITPDEKFEASKLNKFQVQVLRNYGFFGFSTHYFGPMADAHLAKGWTPDEALINQFHQYLLDSKVEFTEGDFTANHQWIKEQLKHEMYITAFSYEQSVRVGIEQDPEIARAVESLPKAVSLLESAKRLLVERINRQQLPLTR